MDIFEDEQPIKSKKDEKLEDLFEEDSSEASSRNEDAELFENNIDLDNIDPEFMQLDEIAEEEEDGKKKKVDKEKKTKKAKNGEYPDIQTELDEKLEQIKERAERLKNKGKDPQKIEKKKENLKAYVIFQTLIMRNPQHYDNFMKLYILCLFSRWQFFTKMCNSKHVLALSLSKLDLVDLNILDKVRTSYAKDREYNFRDRLLSLVGVMLRNFPYEKFNDHHIMFNLSENGTYSYENILMIFYALLKYVGVPVRIVSAIDLVSLNVNKKHLYVAPGMRLPGVKGAIRKRKVDQIQSADKNAIVEEFRPKLKAGKLGKKSFSSMITSFTTSFVDKTEEKADEEDFMGLIEDELNSECGNSQSTRYSLLTKEDREFENKMFSFGFKGGRKSDTTMEVQSEGVEPGQKITYHSGQFSGNNSQSNKANKTNISKFAFGKKNSNSATAPEVDLSEYRYWLEVFDFSQKRWIQVEPLKRKIYEDNEEIKKRLHGSAPLFIITFQKYEFNNEASKFHLEKYKTYYVRDVSVNYIERWHKLLVSRRELNINQWWNQVLGYFKFWPGLSNQYWVDINKMEDEYAIENEKKDVPQNPREFRYSRYYILPSMLKKYQAFFPDAKPLEIRYQEEPIYEKKAMCMLHSRARWRREMRQVKEGEQPAKKVLSLVGNGEQLVDLFGIWQTEPFENKLRDDGSLPKNEYGNYEIFNGELPEGVVYINLPSLPKLCRKLGIDFVEAVTGFEVGKAGRPHAVISGIIAFSKDEEVIRDAYVKYKDYIEEKEREKVKKTVVGLWKGIFRKILVKKYILETYQKEAENIVAT